MYTNPSNSSLSKDPSIFYPIVLFIYILSAVITNSVYSQADKIKNNLCIEGKYYYGFIFPHNKKIEYLIEDHIPAFEINVSKLSVGDDIYDPLYNFPRIGIGFFRADFNNPDVLGTANSLFTFMRIPISRFSDNLTLNCQVSAGLSYLSKKFDLVENNLNIAIGSHLNLHFSAIMDVRIRIMKKFEWTNGISFNHFSNGRVKMPNLGFNYPALFTGLHYHIGDPVQVPERKLPEFKGYFEHLLILSFGIKHRHIQIPNPYLINSFVYDFGRYIRPHIKFSVGLDYFYDGSLQTSHLDSEKVTEFSYLSKVATHMGYHMKYRKFTMLTNLGFYLYSGHKPPALLFTRIGANYRFTEHIIGNISLKAHKVTADFIEWGIGYAF